MTNIQILTAIELLQARLTEDYEDIRQHSNEAGDAPCSEDDRDMFELYRDEIEQIESTIIALKADLYGLKEGELIIIENGEAHVVATYEHNENDYGPHPLRCIEICGLIMDYKEMCKRVAEDGTFVELEAEYTQYPQDGEEDTDEAMIRRYVEEREKYEEVSIAGFCLGKLPDGQYFVPCE